VVAAENDTKIVIATHHGYGFVTRFESLVSRQKSGKAMVALTDGARVLQPALVGDSARDRIVVVTTAGHVLMFSVAELPELDKGGKGNKLIEIPKAKLGTEQVAGIAVVPEGGEVIIWSNGRKLSRKWSDLVEIGGARADRGHLLPRGYTKVEGIERA
jgi:topoisomerase-4 subunit A